MNHMTRLVGMALALLAGATAVSAQTTTTIIERRAPIVLTPEQRTVIYQTVTRGGPRVAPQVEAQVITGVRIPRSVELSALPEEVVVEVPAVKRYKYVYVQNQVVLVDPDTSEVVEVIAR
jgi:hypothetical protein